MSTKKHIRIVDETLRDGSQGDVVMTPSFKINHILQTDRLGWADEIRVGWLTNPSDQEVLDYFAKHKPDLCKKFCMMTLVDLGNNQNVTELFDKFSRDNRFGMAMVATKGRPQDLVDIGTNENGILDAVQKSIAKLKSRMPDRPVELGIEHAFTSYLEGNESYLENAIVKGLLAGAEKVVLADTDGAMMPSQIGTVIRGLSERLTKNRELKERGINFTPSMFSVHTHNDLGLGAANILAAIDEGVCEADISHNNYGERAGNTSLLQTAVILHHSGQYTCGVQQGDLPILAHYTDQLHDSLGTKLGDRAFGSRSAFNAVGGMHASQLLKAYRKMNQESGISIHDFITTLAYAGSYNSVPAPEFGGQIDVTLSPVAGRANVLFMLETMGVTGIQDSDPRLAAVLTKIKDDEMQLGLNYRGRENANAKLLLAEVFGVRKNTEGKANDFSLSSSAGEVRMSIGGKSAAVNAPSFQSGNAHLSDDNNLGFITGRLLKNISSSMKGIAPTLGEIKIVDVRHCELAVGKSHPKNAGAGDITAIGERQLQSVTLIVRDGKNEWRANGTGNTIETALLQATEKAVDYKIYEIEHERATQGKPITFTDLSIQHALASLQKDRLGSRKKS